MRILVIERSPRERRRVADALTPCGHEVHAPESWEDAVLLASAVPPEVIVVDPDFPEAPGWGVIESLRGLHPLERAYTIAHLWRSNPTEYRAAWGAGADDVMRGMVSVEELRGRCEAPGRIRTWAGREELAGGFDLEELGFWRELEPLSARELGSMIGVSLTVGAPGGTQQAASIVLTLPGDGVEVEILLGVDRGGSEALTRHLLGAPATDELVSDTLAEMVNVLGGTCKRAGLRDGHAFSIGLPGGHRPFDPSAGGRCWGLHGESLRFVLCATASRGRPSLLATAELREGMVLARDIRSNSGVLLLAAGVLITERTVCRILSLQGPERKVLAYVPRRLRETAVAA